MYSLLYLELPPPPDYELSSLHIRDMDEYIEEEPRQQPICRQAPPTRTPRPSSKERLSAKTAPIKMKDSRQYRDSVAVSSAISTSSRTATTSLQKKTQYSSNQAPKRPPSREIAAAKKPIDKG